MIVKTSFPIVSIPISEVLLWVSQYSAKLSSATMKRNERIGFSALSRCIALCCTAIFFCFNDLRCQSPHDSVRSYQLNNGIVPAFGFLSLTSARRERDWERDRGSILSWGHVHVHIYRSNPVSKAEQNVYTAKVIPQPSRFLHTATLRHAVRKTTGHKDPEAVTQPLPQCVSINALLVIYLWVCSQRRMANAPSDSRTIHVQFCTIPSTCVRVRQCVKVCSLYGEAATETTKL